LTAEPEPELEAIQPRREAMPVQPLVTLEQIK